MFIFAEYGPADKTHNLEALLLSRCLDFNFQIYPVRTSGLMIKVLGKISIQEFVSFPF